MTATTMAAGAGKEARRTAFILAASQAVIGSAAPIAISLGALAGQYLLGPDKSLATAPVTGFNLGVALGALPVAARLINCCRPEAISAALPELITLGGPVGAYANGFTSIEALKHGTTVDVLHARHDLGPDAYADEAIGWVEAGAGIVGGCCEVGPAHIAALRDRLEQAGYQISGVA